MARFSLCVVLLFFTVATVSALPYLKCIEVARHCSEECEIHTCVVTQKCCPFGGYCFYRNTTARKCGPFQCLNGGTRLPLKGKRDTSGLPPFCEVPLPQCSCPKGFTGRCCQTDLCARVKCGYGMVCKVVPVVCVQAPCPPQAMCVPIDSCDGMVCPDGTSCKGTGSGQAECVRPGTCPTFPGLITTCQFVPGKNCLSDAECQDGYKCCKKGCGRECVKALIDVIDPCIATLCQVGHICVSVKGKATCIPHPDSDPGAATS